MMNINIVLFVFFAAFPFIKGECKIKTQNTVAESFRHPLLINRERTDLLNYLIVQRGYKSYLEIGIADGSNFRAIQVEKKIGVDPSPNASSDYHLTSDDFFKHNKETFDIIFIDGLHLCEQVLRDVENSLSCLNPGGVIVMHDCLPQTIEQQGREPIPGAWNGDVWKAAAYIRMHLANVHFCVIDMDWGCGILTPHSQQQLYPEIPLEHLDWNYYVHHKNVLLNVMSLDTWFKNQR